MSQELVRVLDDLREKGVHLPLSINAAPAGLETVRVSELLDGGPRLREIVERIAQRKGTDDLAAAASLFQKRYCGQLLASILTPLTHLGLGLSATAECMEIVLVEDLPAGLVLHVSAAPTVLRERLAQEDALGAFPRAQSEEQLRQMVFHAMFDENIGRLSMQIATEIGLSLRVMWGNIGNYACYLCDELCKTPDLKQHAIRDRDALLNCTGFESSQPLSCACDSIYLEEANPPRWLRVRSTCCLAYKFAGHTPCYTCPRLSREERVAALGEKALHKA
ncbi:IucA/IucC family C-terminal-domain containing protein [Tumebacillus permanentifrigoris]|uniref:Ferric iron reductase protein FhuF n=1 Tax=Tumebacillus permanentifrigoris TaxID=378543 RepID=A0A316DDN3_9BACL|nr:IucA/IucC family C-terminal-domain containing protein [Tumebacillus permanentifrigoris]PWK14900.1 ferric iron reductase protein FhuF [Tumebacillus permanentifrigoris]